MSKETVFRFYNLRPASPKSDLKLASYSLSKDKSKLVQEFEKSDGSNTTALKNACCALIKKYPTGEKLSVHGKTSVTMLYNWFNQNRNKLAKDAVKDAQFIELTGGESKSTVSLPGAVSAFCSTAADLLLAFAYSGESKPVLKQEISIGLKLIGLRYNASLSGNETLAEYVVKQSIVLPSAALKKNSAGSSGKVRKSVKPSISLPDFSISVEQLEKIRCGISDHFQREKFKSSTTTRAAKSVAADTNLPIRVTNEFINNLAPSFKQILDKLKLNLKQVAVEEALDKIDIEINQRLEYSNQGRMTQTFIQLDGHLVDREFFLQSLQSEGESATPENLLDAGNITATIGDLLLIKQELKGYSLAEIAHVENVLSGEKRERNHRRLNRTTDDYFTETEREESRERDLQSTERNELQNEINRTVATELGLGLGVQVSGSYGPSLSFESQLDSSFSSTVQESQQRASTFSKEVSEKSSEKIRERIKTERRKTKVEEIEEINVHGFENKGDENITGVYRWLDKIYEAQVYTCGQRMMLDFILPEPAAFYLYSMLEDKEIQLDKPLEPMYEKSPLSPDKLKPCNYGRYISAYGVIGAPEPPPQTITVSYFEKQEGKDKADFARSGKIQIPDNYSAVAASVGSFIVHHTRKEAEAVIMIGDRTVDTDANNGWDYVTFVRPREKEIALALHYHNVLNFSAAIDVFCELTPAGLRIWQNKVYEAIMEAYQRRLEEYEEKIETLRGAQSKSAYTTIIGGNGSYHKNCTQTELRKLAIQLLSRNAQPNINSYHEGSPPQMNLTATNENSKIIRFFESAFEWNNMAYVLYSYFWGRQVRWLQAIQVQDDNSDLSAFLKAGAARLQLAVRPGFEKAVAYYLQFGQLWENNDAPIGEENTFLPIIQEISENLGIIEQGIPYPENSSPWEINVPTSLVFLQKENPEFRDNLS